jgi:dihydroorotate dehydrogenase
MFKKGEGYNVVASQGAAAYLAGTSTDTPRPGNSRNGIVHPFAPYPQSGAAINWMGLPNEGHEVVAKRLSRILPVPGCPIGASVSANPAKSGAEAVDGLIKGMEVYHASGVHFIELNESCPNVPHDTQIDSSTGLDSHLMERLESISIRFLKKRSRNLPVIVKFSNDTDVNLIPALVDILIDLGFDGINLGNTSTGYKEIRDMIKPSERSLFDYFTKTFGGGVSGRPLKEKSLALASESAKYIKSRNLPREFHVIRTGGVDSAEDIRKSNDAGIALNQWFTGYFENFAEFGHRVYESILNRD